MVGPGKPAAPKQALQVFRQGQILNFRALGSFLRSAARGSLGRRRTAIQFSDSLSVRQVLMDRDPSVVRQLVAREGAPVIASLLGVGTIHSSCA